MTNTTLKHTEDSTSPKSDNSENSTVFSITLRGKTFTHIDIETIRTCVEEHYDRGRTYISEVICKELGWKQPNGWLKDRACRDVLVQLEKRGLVTLPPSHVTRNLSGEKKRTRSRSRLSDYDVTSPIIDFPDEITLDFAKGNKAEEAWNELVNQNHYLGHDIIVGRCIKYLVRYGARLLGAISFSSPAWRMEARDSLLVSLGVDPTNLQDFVVNNSRFLILPNVNVPNLASKVLSMATARIVADWSNYYTLTPTLAETFVDTSHYLGTCYKAANWVNIGTTKGYAKKGPTHHNSQQPKQIYLYGLNRKMRKDILKVVEVSDEPS